MIFSPLDLVFFNKYSRKKFFFFNKFSRKKLESRVGSIFTFSSRFAKKSSSPKTPPKKLESSPTTHVTETRFLHVLDPPDHFGTIYIFDHFFTFGLGFFSTNLFSRKKLESRVGSIFIFSSRLSPKTPPKKLIESRPTTHVTETRFLHVLDPPDHFGTIYIFDHFFTFGLGFFNKFS